ncbi:YnfA family protein [Methanosarcina sp.]|uniref:YnfA family protein n=1 Tax=Methanosarcina sp. TaxID=2213 RepID=UPI002988C85E|nr:YnfA family protein [Methanosarcina sp.]MDW5548842.1 YnfA family protein [Methanosarcina sp.]MDW5553755.1 YnfA family protein [Methanosarcina sp.]MDW5558981.1 YnfA family protein [Methanosarcina sp.]
MIDSVVSLVLFFLAALFEIGGGYLVWLWLREKKRAVFGLLGGLMLAVYGIIPTFHPANFGRVYAAYGGIFIVSSLIWGALIDKKNPEKYEIIGALIALAGVLIMFYIPR